MALTRALVRIPSVNPLLEPGGAGEEAVARRAADWLDGWGFEVALAEVAPGRWNVVGRRGPAGGPSLMLNGHLDTVGVEGMQVDPFAGDLVDGRILGRGACDMKAGVGALLAAAAATRHDDLEGRLIVALTCDEEHASLGMQAVVVAERADMAVVCEPTGLAVMPAHKGFVWAEAVFEGRAAHGSRPEVGVDAVRHAGRFLVALESLDPSLGERPAHPLLGRGSWHAGTIEGGDAPSVYPARCRLVLERRTLPDETADAVMAEFGAVLEEVVAGVEGLGATLSCALFRPGSDVPAEAPVVTGLVEAARAEGLPGRVAGMTAWVDAAFLNAAGTPAVCFGPGSIEQAHTADEWVDAAEVVAAARVLTRFVRARLARGAG
ncbi:MAG: M20/M25/M40 family metallo-hydrolase [Gemmatimonadetes bacterium]|nr:MAG: M20/M25/M40 family metallo-hydrolase [Gemmatimonadota bacterium]